ncbi:hypothetical protein ACHAWF_008401 [Thalassiosira exigua]
MSNDRFDKAENTANDEAIARAIAQSEGHSRCAQIVVGHAPPSASSASVKNCPDNHGLEPFQVSDSQRVHCNGGCRQRLWSGDTVWSCVRCNFDCCERCYRKGGQVITPAPRSTSTTSHQNGTSTSNRPSSIPEILPPVQRNNPFSGGRVSTHMCLIPCTIGSITVEMLVDTGAQSSVLSMPLVRQLNLSNRLDRRYQGVAAGVGRARITGSIRNVVCAFGVGHVEFLMDFIALDVSDPLVILGLDQLRKYKCLVDMEKSVLIFGGAGGVEVEMLPPNQAHFEMRSLNGCPMM